MGMRIVKRDKHNWVLQRERESGGYAVVGHFFKLKHAATRMMDELLADDWPVDGWTGAELARQIQDAEDRILAAVCEALGEQQPPPASEVEEVEEADEELEQEPVFEETAETVPSAPRRVRSVFQPRRQPTNID